MIIKERETLADKVSAVFFTFYYSSFKNRQIC